MEENVSRSAVGAPTRAQSPPTASGPTRTNDLARARAALLGLVAAVALGLGLAAPAAPAALLSHFDVSSSSTQAGAYADVTTSFDATDLIGNPVNTLRFHMPKGQLGTISNFAACTLEQFTATACAPETVVGTATVRLNAGSQEFPLIVPLPGTVHVLTSRRGEVAQLGISVFTIAKVLLHINVRPDDYGLDATVDGLQNIVQGTDLTLWGVPWDHWDPATQSRTRRLPFMANPASCGVETETVVEVNDYRQRDVWETYRATTPAQTGCDAQRFEPEVTVETDNPFTSRPSSFGFAIELPQNTDPDELQTPPLKDVTAVLPEGLTLNPSVANGLQACSDAAFGQGSGERSSCPAASRIGTAEFSVPALQDPHVAGTIYIGQPLPGDRYRIFVEAYGSSVRVKLKGSVRPDPKTGRLTTVFENNPQTPVSSVKLTFRGGSRAALAMPDGCGTKQVLSTISSWGGQTASPSAVFDVAFDANGTPCPPQAFTPTFAAGVSNPTAGAHATFALEVTKADGQADLDRVSLTLPKGLLANLKGNLGSRVGTARIAAGVGPSPFWFTGSVTLEGPYGDAPFSLRVAVPVVAGPYDLGEVVVRQKLYVDPNDAHVTVVSDPLPTIWEGIPVRLQRLSVAIDKAGFMQNPTSCAATAIGGTLGAASGQRHEVSSRFQVGGCGDLPYAPKLGLKVSGELKNGGHPQLDATLSPRKGDANHRKAQVTLPLNLALDPQNAKALCEPAQAAANSCPAESIVGNAKAVSILDVPLEGPVFFVRGERKTSTGRVVATLPKLYIPLSGQGVRINVRASSDVVDKKLQTTFDNLPDAPIERFDLTVNGGANGILKVTNGDVCKTGSTPKVGQRMTGQNGKVFRSTSTLGTTCAFGIAKTARKGNRLTVTVAGLTGGRVTVSGQGLSTNRRTFGSSSTVANVGVSLNAASQRALKQGQTLRIKVKTSFKPAKKGAKTVSKTAMVVVKPAKKAAR